MNLSPANVGFGTVEVGSTSGPLPVMAANGGTAVPITSVSVSGPFTIFSNGCGNALAAGSECQIMVKFAPTQAGAAAGTLTMVDGAGTQQVS